MTYGVANNPTSGERFAVEWNEEGRIVRAAGPLHHEDSTDEDSLAMWITNHSATAEDDGLWLDEAINKANIDH